jgi:hypothetical protein
MILIQFMQCFSIALFNQMLEIPHVRCRRGAYWDELRNCQKPAVGLPSKTEFGYPKW